MDSSSSSPIANGYVHPSYGTVNNSELDEENRLDSAVPFLGLGKTDSYKKRPIYSRALWESLTWTMFLILGVGTLLPWNLFITANDYFIRKSGIKDFEVYLILVAQVPNFIFFLLTIFIKEFLGASRRIYISLAVMLSLFVVTIILTEIQMNTLIFLIITFLCIAVINAVSGLYQTTVLGVTGVFPSIHTQAVLVGQGIGGILPAVILVLSIFTVRRLGLPSDSPTYLNTSACIYFVFATLCIATCITAYFFLTKITFSKRRFRTLPSPRKHLFLKTLPHEIKHVIKFIWVDCFTVFFVFFITLSLFPAITSLVISETKFNVSTETGDICSCPQDNLTHNISSNLTAPIAPCGDWTCLYFTPIFCFFAFNLFDSIGRFIAGFTAKCKIPSLLLALLAIFRVVFIPLIFMCNINGKHIFPFWLHYDSIFLILIVTLGISNGLLSSISMMHGPRKVDPKHGETATILMALFLGLGLLLGSVFSFILEKTFIRH